MGSQRRPRALLRAPSVTNGRSCPTRWWIGRLPTNSQRIAPPAFPPRKRLKSTRKSKPNAAPKRPKLPRSRPTCIYPKLAECCCSIPFRLSRNSCCCSRTPGNSTKTRKQTSCAPPSTPSPAASRPSSSKAPHASVQAHATLPTIYINLDQDQTSNSTSQQQQPQQPQQPQQAEQPWDRYKIVRVQEKKGKRVHRRHKSQRTGKNQPGTESGSNHCAKADRRLGQGHTFGRS